MPNKKKNAYYEFVMDYQQQQKPRVFPSFDAASSEASFKWAGMTKEQKEPYEVRAKEGRQSNAPNTKAGHGYKKKSGKMTSTRELVDDVEEKNAAIERENNLMFKTIDNLIDQAAQKDELCDLKFFLISTNYYCVTDNGDYLTCEIALSEFTLRNGVSNVYHTFVDPGPIPPGFKFKQIENTKEHKIELPYNTDIPLEPITDNFLQIYKEVSRKLNKGNGDFFPCYTLPVYMNQIKNFMSKLSETAEDCDIAIANNFKIYNLEYAFYKMHNTCRLQMKDPVVPFAVAKELLVKDMHCYESEISCDYHIEKDCLNRCAKSLVNRWGYYFAEANLSYFKIEPVKGAHVPKKGGKWKSVSSTTGSSSFTNRKTPVDSLSLDSMSIASEPAQSSWGSKASSYRAPSGALPPSNSYASYGRKTEFKPAARSTETYKVSEDQFPALGFKIRSSVPPVITNQPNRNGAACNNLQPTNGRPQQGGSPQSRGFTQPRGLPRSVRGAKSLGAIGFKHEDLEANEDGSSMEPVYADLKKNVKEDISIIEGTQESTTEKQAFEPFPDPRYDHPDVEDPENENGSPAIRKSRLAATWCTESK